MSGSIRRSSWTPLCGRGQAVRAGRAARSRAEVQTGAGPPALEPARWHDLEKARHAFKKAMATWPKSCSSSIRAKSGPWHAFTLTPIGTGIRRRLRVGADTRPGTATADIKATWSRPRRWTGCCVATWLREDRGWPCVPRSSRDGRQAIAFLAPTTVLAFQHLKT